MKVTEFFLFFGPKIWSFKRGETEYGIKCIPAGAYVRIIGMSNIETDVPPEDEPRTYRQQSYPKRVLVASAGSIMHVLQAFVLLFVAFTRARRARQQRRSAQRLGGPAPDRDRVDGGQRRTRHRRGDRRPRGRRRRRQHRRPARSRSGRTSAQQVAPNPATTVPIVVLRDGETLELEATLGTRAARRRTARPPATRASSGMSPQDEELPDRPRGRVPRDGGGRSAHRGADGPHRRPGWRRSSPAASTTSRPTSPKAAAQPSGHAPPASEPRHPPARRTTNGSCRSSASPASAPASSRRACSASSC